MGLGESPGLCKPASWRSPGQAEGVWPYMVRDDYQLTTAIFGCLPTRNGSFAGGGPGCDK